MENNELLKLAEDIRDGKASQEDKIKFLKMINLELEEVSKILESTKQNKNDGKI